jgi:hypothetical protein
MNCMKQRATISIPLLLSALLVLATLTARASQEDRRRAHVNAATAAAVDRLLQDVTALRINSQLTVGEFVHTTESIDELTQVLHRARQIGGPRWVDEQTCQIQLEISGQAVADTLVDIAARRPRQSPVQAEALARELRGWQDRSFSATGTSQSAERVTHLRPVRATAWDRIDDTVRQQAIGIARQDAARRALDSVRSVELLPGLTVNDALSQPDVARHMTRWYDQRPIKIVTFKEDLQVDLTLGAPAEEAFDVLVAALGQSDAVAVPQDPQGLAAARSMFIQRMAEPVGRANVSVAALAEQPETLTIPQQVPDWVSRQLDAEGHSPPSRQRPLAGVQAATERANQNLRAQLGKLPLREGLTLDDAARKDPRIGQALDRAMFRARVYKVEHDADGSTTVRVMIDPRDVWSEIANAR